MGLSGDLFIQERMAENSDKVKFVRKRYFIDGIEEAIHNAVNRLSKEQFLRRDEILIYIPPVLQTLIFREYSSGFYGSAKEKHTKRRLITSIMGHKVIEGYESNTVVVSAKDADMRSIKPIKITVGVK